jgi:hypothetical protein
LKEAIKHRESKEHWEGKDVWEKDERELSSQPVGVVPPMECLARQELTAFFLSWLYALALPVINRPTPQGLAGQRRQRSEWLWLAAHAGLPMPRYRQTSQDSTAGQGGQGLVIAETPVHTVFILTHPPFSALTLENHVPLPMGRRGKQLISPPSSPRALPLSLMSRVCCRTDPWYPSAYTTEIQESSMG